MSEGRLPDGTPCTEQTASCARLVREAFESTVDFRAFHALAENTPDTIARYDCQGVRTYANPAMARMAGVSAADLLGKKPSHNDIPQMLAYEATLLDVIRSGQPAEYELSWTGASGHPIISQIRLVPKLGRMAVSNTTASIANRSTTAVILPRTLVLTDVGGIWRAPSAAWPSPAIAWCRAASTATTIGKTSRYNSTSSF